eukprot:5057345-Alexandrium_andersonii.AAC.1
MGRALGRGGGGSKGNKYYIDESSLEFDNSNRPPVPLQFPCADCRRASKLKPGVSEVKLR